jgi:hypothetical protein
MCYDKFLNRLIFLLGLSVAQVESAKILILHPIYCGSHEFVLRKFGDHLVSRGHEVTQVSGNYCIDL